VKAVTNQSTENEVGSSSNDAATQPPSEQNQAEAGANQESEHRPDTTTPGTPVPKRSVPTLERLDTNVSSKSSLATDTDTLSPIVPPVVLKAGQCSSIACDYEWEFPSDIYACRDCFKIICPPCVKLMGRGLTRNTWYPRGVSPKLVPSRSCVRHRLTIPPINLGATRVSGMARARTSIATKRTRTCTSRQSMRKSSSIDREILSGWLERTCRYSSGWMVSRATGDWSREVSRPESG
jgi:hypothetical protein